MDPENLIQYVKKPESLNSGTLYEVEKLTQKYPYFQTAQLLAVKNLHLTNSEDYRTQLNLTAAYVTDRKILYYLLHNIEFSIQQPSEDEQEVASAEPGLREEMKENISEALAAQIEFLNNSTDDDLKIDIAIDVKKEYGQGLDIEEHIIKLNKEEEKPAGETNIEDILVIENDDIFLEDKTITHDLDEEAKNIEPANDLIEIVEIETKEKRAAEETSTKEPEKAETIREISEKEAEPETSGQQEDIETKAKTDSATPEETEDEEERNPVEYISNDVDEPETSPKEDVKSFTGWLDMLNIDTASSQKTEPKKSTSEIKEEEKEKQEDNKEAKTKPDITENKTLYHNQLIDDFIKKNPRIVPDESKITNEDISKKSVKEHDSFITDTLARIYIKQGNYTKAIFAYEKLSLKYPEKSTYFAQQISEIKKLIAK